MLIFVLLATASCGAGKSSKASADTGAGARAKVSEDLSAFRPKYEAPASDRASAVAVVTPTHHVNDQVAVLMDTVASVNKNIKYAQGYRILAYNGSERQTVMNLRKAIIARLPEQKDYLTYQQPNFRLKIGDYFSRIEAQQVLNKISDLIPDALIVNDQINVK